MLGVLAFAVTPMLTIIVSLPFALSAAAMLLETWWRNKQ
jgi:preprotein translocase subunit SecD